MAGQDAAVAAAPPTMLAPGFRFHPTDEELVRYYLKRKACGQPFRLQAVAETDVYKAEPWELAALSSLRTRDLEWYFFSPVDKRYGSGSRFNRATGQGYWKATGNDRAVKHNNETIGMKKTLVYHSGRAPNGQRTNWVMHEYRLCDAELQNAGAIKFVLCRVFQKAAAGPPNGDQFAPFVEEEWENNNDAPLLIAGRDAVDGAANVGEEEAQLALTVVGEDVAPLAIAPPPQVENPIGLVGPAEAADDNSNRAKSRAVGSANVEKSVLPGFLKFIGDLEGEILSASMERESLKIEVMRARAMINVLQSRANALSAENEDVRRRG